MPRWTADQIPDQAGRTAVVTGANSGLGLVTARELARRGARIIMGVRAVGKGERAAADIRAAAPGAGLEVRRLDLGDLASVRAFASEVAATHPALDLLINNAGIMMPPRGTTADGFETQLGTNHLGPFALTGLLLAALQATPGARVVTVSSIEHKPGHIDFEDLQKERSYAPRNAYRQSKMANALFGLELDRRLRQAGSPLISVLAHPGYSDTNLQTSGPSGIARLAMKYVGNRVIAQSAERGALPQLFAATAPGVEGGAFYGPDGFQEMRGHPTLVQPTLEATDPDIARRLWAVSEELTGVSYPLPTPVASP